MKRFALAAFFCLTATLAQAVEVRLKDLLTIEGYRQNSLVGYGLVVGLNGSGDSLRNSPFTEQILNNTLERLGVNVTGEDFRPENVAAVIVTADLPAFAQTGMEIDVTVSAIGDAKSLRGGTLVMTPLKAPDGEIYVVAQGNLIGEGRVDRADAGTVSVGVPTSAKIPMGGRVERALAFSFDDLQELNLALNFPDFSTASLVEASINRKLGAGAARMADATRIVVSIPSRFRNRMARLVAEIENITVSPENKARVIVNQKTGTIVFNDRVTLSQVALAHNEVVVRIKEMAFASQPNPFAEGQTMLVPRSDIAFEENGPDRLIQIAPAPTLSDLVAGFNALGVDAQTMIDVVKTIHASGALHAELVVQ